MVSGMGFLGWRAGGYSFWVAQGLGGGDTMDHLEGQTKVEHNHTSFAQDWGKGKGRWQWPVEGKCPSSAQMPTRSAIHKSSWKPPLLRLSFPFSFPLLSTKLLKKYLLFPCISFAKYCLFVSM
jgi:hypothetical protein